MSGADLRLFFSPSSVALVGATQDTSRFGGRCLNRLLKFGYKGEIYPVNPGYKELRGLTCYPDVMHLPVVPDHVGIVVPAESVMTVLRQCADRGVRFATVFTGGFAETGTGEGRQMQDTLTQFARKSGMRIMGPNCNGFVNFVDGLAMTSSGSVAGPRRPAGNIGIVSQSGGLGQVNVMWRAQELGLGVSYEASCGNSADLNAFDFADFLVDDERTHVILMVMEEIGDGARFVATARRAAQREKPIVMLKLGRTEAGARAAASHTGAMAGQDDICDAALRQFGIIRVDDCNELYEVAMLLRTRRWPRGRRAAAAGVSGGNGVLIVDLGSSMGIRWPEYSVETQASLRRCLPKHGTTTNPTDVTPAAIGKKGVYRDCMDAIARDEGVDVVIPMLTLAAAADAREVAEAAKAVEKPVALLWTGGCIDDPAFGATQLIADGVPVYRDTLSCLKAVRAAMRYGEFLSAFRERSRSQRQAPPGTNTVRARELLQAAGGRLSEHASKLVLAAFGLPVGDESLAFSADDAVRIWRSTGSAVAIKIASPDIPHKTEAGAVRLNVNDERSVRDAYEQVLKAAALYAPAGRLQGVLVQRMAPPGLEMMLGVVTDPVFGPVVAAGPGGVFVEVMRDMAYRVAPIDVEEARSMLSELRSARVLEGFRGSGPRDVNALCDYLSRLSWLACEMRDEIAEIDVNPLSLQEAGNGGLVVDALIVPRAIGAAVPRAAA